MDPDVAPPPAPPRDAAPAGGTKWQTGAVLLEEFAAIYPDRASLGGLETPAFEMFARANKLQGDAARQGWKALGAEGQDAARLDLYNALVGSLPGERAQAAICLSGGGIRSAAFALGILQGLARHGLLSRFHYLSTVSGGGYIGGWLTAWACRAAARRADGAAGQSFKAVETDLANAGPGPGPLGQLRKYQSFLTPQSGLASPDTWGTVAHVVRNLLLNWLVFVPLLAALLLLPRVLQTWLQYWSQDTPFVAHGSSLRSMKDYLASWGAAPGLFAAWPLWHFWLDSIGAVCVGIGVVFSMVNRSTEGAYSINDTGFLRYVVLPVAAGALCLISSVCFWFHATPGLPVDTAMFVDWTTLCAAVFVVLRLVAFVWVWIKRGGDAGERLSLRWKLVETLAQGCAGALVGVSICAGIRLGAPLALRDDMADLGMVAVFGPPWFLLSFVLGQVLLAGLTSHLYETSGDRNREWLARASGWYAAVALAWLAFAAVVVFGWDRLFAHWAWSSAGLTAGSGALSLMGGASPITKALSMATGGERLRSSTLVSALSVVFALCLAIWIAHGTDLLLPRVSALVSDVVGQAWQIGDGGRLWDDGPYQSAGLGLCWSAGAAVALAVAGARASRFVNVNLFSLNGLYRNRLVRAFLGSSNIAGIAARPGKRNPFDGLAESDDPLMAELWTGVAAGGTPGEHRAVPFPVVNMTLNLTATSDTAWQERKAAPFIATPLRAGGHLVGYRPVAQYAKGSGKGLTLGTCMSVSGAAASPNWGYHSSPVTSFLMAIFNVRLGAWLGNPNDNKHWDSDGPKAGWRLFVQEALGHTTDTQRYVYLSDGGHFENLGLYEMVRRRCRTIVVSDATADPDGTLEDLGNAVRKISIDLGVRIEFEPIYTRKRAADLSAPGVYCAKGTILYPEDPDGARPGTIIYIKAGLYDDAPADVRAYAAADAKFPHDSTLNQWFTESQFESYRALGSHVIRMMTCRRKTDGSFDQADERAQLDMAAFVSCVDGYLKRYVAQRGRPVPIRLVS